MVKGEEFKQYGRATSSPTVIKVKKTINTQGIGKDDFHSAYIQTSLDENIFKFDIHPYQIFDKPLINVNIPAPPTLSDQDIQSYPFLAQCKKNYEERDEKYKEQLELLNAGGKKRSEKEKIAQRGTDVKVDKEGWLVKEGRIRKTWKKR